MLLPPPKAPVAACVGGSGAHAPRFSDSTNASFAREVEWFLVAPRMSALRPNVGHSGQFVACLEADLRQVLIELSFG